MSGIVENMPPAARKIEKYFIDKVCDALDCNHAAAAPEVIQEGEGEDGVVEPLDSTLLMVAAREDWMCAVAARVK